MDRMAKFTAEDWARLGDRVRRRRTSLGLTQDQLATAAGVSFNTVGNIESGRRSRELNLSKVAKALGWQSESFWLILEGGDPIVEDVPGEPVTDDAWHVERPSGTSAEDWERMKADMAEYLETMLRWRKGQ